MPQYYLWFAIGVFIFVMISFLRSYLFWKRVQGAENLSELSEADQRQYEKFQMEWPHHTLATQKIYETKLLMVAFGAITLISVLVYWFLSTRW
ncbi:MAG TPA: hypothetical protein GX733_02555 [Tissierellia bacterium]|jgi:hypothetical protein|nr:hypothetical protein [Tissierellia bacterium]